METANGITAKLSVFCKATLSPELVGHYFPPESALFCEVFEKNLKSEYCIVDNKEFMILSLNSLVEKKKSTFQVVF